VQPLQGVALERAYQRGDILDKRLSLSSPRIACEASQIRQHQLGAADRQIGHQHAAMLAAVLITLLVLPGTVGGVRTVFNDSSGRAPRARHWVTSESSDRKGDMV